jgi:membrane protease YdiL (CAAX protease family)
MLFETAFSGKNHGWRYLLGVIIVLFAYVLGQIPLSLLLKAKGLSEDEMAEFAGNMDFQGIGVSQTLGLALLLMMFIVGLAALYLVVRFLHAKVFRHLITPAESIDFRKVGFAFALWFAIGLVIEGVGYFMDPNAYQFSYDPTVFFPLLLVALLMIPLQTSFEEVFFRGYILQGVGLMSKNKWIPLLLTTGIFAAMHGANPEIERFGFWSMMSYYIVAGLFLGIVTILDDSLELALGIHAATNIMGAVLFSYDGGAMQTDSLFTTSDINPWQVTLLFILGATLFLIICSKKYHWLGWSALFTEIRKPQSMIQEEERMTK